MLSYLIPNVWNNSPQVYLLKLLNSVKEHKKHRVKEHFFKKLKNKEQVFSLIDAVSAILNY